MASWCGLGSGDDNGRSGEVVNNPGQDDSREVRDRPRRCSGKLSSGTRHHERSDEARNDDDYSRQRRNQEPAQQFEALFISAQFLERFHDLAAQHRAALRFLPMVPRVCTLRMYSGADGTRQAVLPMSTVTRPIFSAVFIARSVSDFT